MPSPLGSMPQRPMFMGLGGKDAERYLKSCGMTCSLVERVNPRNVQTYTWFAKTDRGDRYVTWSPTTKKWTVSRSAP